LLKDNTKETIERYIASHPEQQFGFFNQPVNKAKVLHSQGH